MANFTISVIELSVQLQIPVGLENSLGSRLWLLPKMCQLSTLPCAQEVKLHMCQFGAPWMKPTRVFLWSCPPADAARRQCRRKTTKCGPS
eukprot:3356096-Lingulodinium_polyedra.AAC.1